MTTTAVPSRLDLGRYRNATRTHDAARVALLVSGLFLCGCTDAVSNAETPPTLRSDVTGDARKPRVDPVTTLRLSYFNVPPHISWDAARERPVGALVDLLEDYIAPELEVELVWLSPAPIPRILKQLESGHVDAAAIMAKSPERATSFRYPSEPFWRSVPVLVVRDSHPLERVDSIDDVLGLRIGYMQNSFVSPFMRDPRIDWSNPASASSVEQNLQRLLLGRIDAQYNLEAAPILGLAKPHELDRLRFLPLPEESMLYTVFGRDQSPELVDRYAATLERLGGIEFYTRELLSRYVDIARLPGH